MVENVHETKNWQKDFFLVCLVGTYKWNNVKTCMHVIMRLSFIVILAEKKSDCPFPGHVKETCSFLHMTGNNEY